MIIIRLLKQIYKELWWLKVALHTGDKEYGPRRYSLRWLGEWCLVLFVGVPCLVVINAISGILAPISYHLRWPR